jgi:DNA-binding XRE family transcriptional regulator
MTDSLSSAGTNPRPRYVAQRGTVGWTVVSTGNGQVVGQYARGSLGAEQAAAAAAALNRERAVRDSLSSAATNPAITPAMLKIWRRKQHTTQGELARQLGLHISTVHRWECGEVPIPVWLRFALEGLDRRHDQPD